MPATNEARTDQRKPQRTVQRQRLMTVDTDQFGYDTDKIPHGMSYNWKRVTIAAKPDTKHQVVMAKQGWTPVPAKRHPEIVGDEYALKHPDGEILVGGQVLMERPTELTREAEREDYDKATGQVSNQMKSLKLTPDGSLPRKVQVASRRHDIPVTAPDDE